MEHGPRRDNPTDFRAQPVVDAIYTTTRYFLLNTAILILAATAYYTTVMGTWDHLPTNLLMGSLNGIVCGGMLSALMLIPFLITRVILVRRKITRWCRLWLCGPSFGIAAFLMTMTFWISLPSQRLRFVAQDDLIGASRVRVTGYTGLLAGDFVAACSLDEAAFLSWCRRQNLTVEKKVDIQDKLKHRSLIRSAKLVTTLPAFTSPLQFSRLEGDNDRFGVFALYDQNSGTAVIYRYFHD